MAPTALAAALKPSAVALFWPLPCAPACAAVPTAVSPELLKPLAGVPPWLTLPPAKASRPSAVELPPVAPAVTPSAVDALPNAWALVPMAVESAPVACEISPNAEAEFPLAVLDAPTAVEKAPVAFAEWPHAVSEDEPPSFSPVIPLPLQSAARDAAGKSDARANARQPAMTTVRSLRLRSRQFRSPGDADASPVVTRPSQARNSTAITPLRTRGGVAANEALQRRQGRPAPLLPAATVAAPARQVPVHFWVSRRSAGPFKQIFDRCADQATCANGRGPIVRG